MTEFSSNIINCNVYYRPGFLDHDVERLENIHHEIIYFKSADHYIKEFIDYIKQNVIKQYPNLSLIKIQVNVLDNGNIWHRLFVTVSNMISVILKHKRHSVNKYNKYVFVSVTYDKKTVFIGCIDFNNI